MEVLPRNVLIYLMLSTFYILRIFFNNLILYHAVLCMFYYYGIQESGITMYYYVTILQCYDAYMYYMYGIHFFLYKIIPCLYCTMI